MTGKKKAMKCNNSKDDREFEVRLLAYTLVRKSFRTRVSSVPFRKYERYVSLMIQISNCCTPFLPRRMTGAGCWNFLINFIPARWAGLWNATPSG